MTQPKPTLALDFDGVLHSYRGWTGHSKLSEPVPGAVAFCRAAAERFHLVVYSARAKDPDQRLAMGIWLSQHSFPAMFVVADKPPALVYLDDRAWRFDGQWPDVGALAAFRAWWEEPASEKPTNPTIREIVKAFLVQHGYDGLWCEWCACNLDDLFPCDECPGDDCQAGHIVPCPGIEECECEGGREDGDGHYHIGVKEPTP